MHAGRSLTKKSAHFLASLVSRSVGLRSTLNIVLSVLIHALIFNAIMKAGSPELADKRASVEIDETVEFVAFQSEPEDTVRMAEEGPSLETLSKRTKRKKLKLLDRLKRRPELKANKTPASEAKKEDKKNLIKKLAQSHKRRNSHFFKSPLSLDKSLFKVQNKASHTDQEIESSELLKVVSQNDKAFQKCYEKALLTDETLAGQVEFNLETDRIGQVARTLVRFAGKGTPASAKMLKTCLKTAAKGLLFSRQAANVQIKFNLLML